MMTLVCGGIFMEKHLQELKYPGKLERKSIDTLGKLHSSKCCCPCLIVFYRMETSTTKSQKGKTQLARRNTVSSMYEELIANADKSDSEQG